MRILMIDGDTVRELLPMGTCIELMRDTLAALARGELHQPLRTTIRPPGSNGLLSLMPSYRDQPQRAFGLKAICVFPENPSRGLDTHLGVVALFDGETGELRAMADASAVTAIRTAAVSAVATDVLARPDAADLAVVGAGVQARSHITAMALVRPIRSIRIAGRSRDRAEQLAEWARRSARIPVTVTTTVEEALRGATLVCTVSSSISPVVRSQWVAPGTHLNVVGSSTPSAREVDGATMARAALFVDRRESLERESGDYLFAIAERAISAGHVRAEVGEVLIGVAPGRRTPEEVTLFKSLGLAVEDLAAISYLYERATRVGRGTWVEL